MASPPDHHHSGLHPHLHTRRATEALKDHHLTAKQQNAAIAAERASQAQNGVQAPETGNQGSPGAG